MELSAHKALLPCGGGGLSVCRSGRGEPMIERLGPHPEGLELQVSVAAKVVSKGWGSVTLSPRYERASTPTANSSCATGCVSRRVTHAGVMAMKA